MATPEARYQAEQAMLSQTGGREGRRPYFGSLVDSAAPEALQAGRDAWDAALAEIDAQRAEAEALAALQAEDADESFGGDDEPGSGS